MSYDADCLDASAETRCPNGTTIVEEPVRTSRPLSETILNVLSRDNRLRRTYVRRRWQGLVE